MLRQKHQEFASPSTILLSLGLAAAVLAPTACSDDDSTDGVLDASALNTDDAGSEPTEGSDDDDAEGSDNDDAEGSDDDDDEPGNGGGGPAPASEDAGNDDDDSDDDDSCPTAAPLGAAEMNALNLIEQGRQSFRFETFGNEAFFSGALRLNEVVAAALDPTTALSLGFRVDVDALPEAVRTALANGDVDLESVDTTLDLLRLNAIVGVTGEFNDDDELETIGLNCALCHSEVDNSFAPGIGSRIDGTPNRDFNAGAVLALAPDLSAFVNLLEVANPGIDEDTVRAVLNSWGPGRFDGHLVFDGTAFDPEGNTGALLNPPLSGRAGVNTATYAGWGSIAYWLALVPNIELNGQGTFLDARLNNADEFPVAAAANLGQVRNTPDLITPAIPGMHMYILSLPAPIPAEGSFDEEAAARGEELFNGEAQCSTCHVPPLYTEPGWNVHPAEDIGIDGFTASRGPDNVYRTTPLGGLFARQTGGFYHDGRFEDLEEVVDHYNGFLALNLTSRQTDDLVQFLLSL